MAPPLARHPPHPCYTSQHVTQASTLLMLAHHPCKHVTHASTLPKQARYPRHPRQHVTHASTPHTPLTLARHPRQHATHATHASTNSMPFLKRITCSFHIFVRYSQLISEDSSRFWLEYFCMSLLFYCQHVNH